MIKAVLFDLDGTLVNSLYDLSGAVNSALSDLGLPTHEVEAYKYFVGNGIPNLVMRALPPDKNSGEIFERCKDLTMKYYSAHFADKTKPYSGIMELLDELKQRGIKIGVTSNKAHDMTLKVIESVMNVEFDCINGKKDGVPIKPDPAALLNTAKELSVNPQECVFVGDSGSDMVAAINAEMVPVGVLWGFRTAKELNDNGAQYLVSEPSELLPLVLSL